MKEKFIRTVYKIPGELGNESKSDVAMLKLIQLIGGEDRKEIRFADLPGVVLEYFTNEDGENFVTPSGEAIFGRALFYKEGLRSLTAEEVEACLAMCNGGEEEKKSMKYIVTVTQRHSTDVSIGYLEKNKFIFDEFNEAEEFAKFAKAHSAAKIEKIEIEIEKLTYFKAEEKDDSAA